MKGLTAAEHGYLSSLIPECQWWLQGEGPLLTAAEKEAAENLAEQGRLRIDADRCRCGWSHDAITPAGREALRLWPLVKSAMEGER